MNFSFLLSAGDRRHTSHWIGICSLLVYISTACHSPEPLPEIAPIVQLHGLNFSPYTNGQSPSQGIEISEAQIRERLALIHQSTLWVRTFGATHGLEHTGRIAKEMGLKVAVGAWLSRNQAANEAEIENLIEIAQAGHADIVIVGSEVLLRKDLTLQQLLDYINRVKEAIPVGIPVTTADVYGIWMENPDLIKIVDEVWANYYPYWEGTPITCAMSRLDASHQLLTKAAGEKEVIISESGWPSGGNAIGKALPSLENACRYFGEFVTWAETRDVKYFYFAGFDEKWKIQGGLTQEGHWGIFDSKGALKPCMLPVFLGSRTEVTWEIDSVTGPGDTIGWELTHVPALNTSENLEGRVWNLDPEDYHIATYIKVAGRWWTKPTFLHPTVPIQCDGSFEVDITTGGNDPKATEIAVYLLPVDCEPQKASGSMQIPITAEDCSLLVKWIER